MVYLKYKKKVHIVSLNCIKLYMHELIWWNIFSVSVFCPPKKSPPKEHSLKTTVFINNSCNGNGLFQQSYYMSKNTSELTLNN